MNKEKLEIIFKGEYERDNRAFNVFCFRKKLKC